MRWLAAIGALAIVIGVGAAIFFFGGFYSVAGTAEDPAVVKWALEKVRLASIDRHATAKAPAGFSSDDMTQAGARVFARLGCVNCHGAPGADWAKFSEGLRPDPPDLKDVAPARTPEQIFWTVKNGINMTGMPSFARAGASDDDLWRVTAFVKKLPQVSEDQFKQWTAPQSGESAADGARAP